MGKILLWAQWCSSCGRRSSSSSRVTTCSIVTIYLHTFQKKISSPAWLIHSWGNVIFSGSGKTMSSCVYWQSAAPPRANDELKVCVGGRDIGAADRRRSNQVISVPNLCWLCCTWFTYRQRFTLGDSVSLRQPAFPFPFQTSSKASVLPGGCEQRAKCFRLFRVCVCVTRSSVEKPPANLQIRAASFAF